MDPLFEGQWQILERVAQGAPQREVLDSIVRLIEAQSEGLLCSILLFDPRRQTLRHGAAPSLPPEYVSMIDGAAIGPGAGSCGAAAFTQQPVIVEDTAVHPNWAPWRELALRHQLRACWSTPIFSPERALLGTFALYYRAPRRPTQVEERWVATATHLTSISIALSRQAELAEELRQAQRMEAVGKLAGGIAHDFNNLLSVIIGYSAMIADSLQPTDPLLADVEEVRRAASRACELTRQLLAFSRQQALRPRVVGLNDALRGLEKMLRRLLGEDVFFVLETSAAASYIRVDPGQLEQVVMNLVVNARDAMPCGGELRVCTDESWLDETYAALHPGVVPGAYVTLTVSDSGEGMDAATQARIFEPFFTTKEQGKGTGLGLSTVWGIVTQSGGSIAVKSQPGSGTRFEVHFPAVAAPLEPDQAEDPRPQPQTGSETVLVVEDEEQVRSLVCSVLRRAGYRVLEAPDGVSGLELGMSYAADIDLLLTDVIMPHMNGRDLAERLSVARPRMKVLYISGYTENAMIRSGISDGTIAFLAKPVAPKALLREVRDVLNCAARRS